MAFPCLPKIGFDLSRNHTAQHLWCMCFGQTFIFTPFCTPFSEQQLKSWSFYPFGFHWKFIPELSRGGSNTHFPLTFHTEVRWVKLDQKGLKETSSLDGENTLNFVIMRVLFKQCRREICPAWRSASWSSRSSSRSRSRPRPCLVLVDTACAWNWIRDVKFLISPILTMYGLTHNLHQNESKASSLPVHPNFFRRPFLCPPWKSVNASCWSGD